MSVHQKPSTSPVQYQLLACTTVDPQSAMATAKTAAARKSLVELNRVHVGLIVARGIGCLLFLAAAAGPAIHRLGLAFSHRVWWLGMVALPQIETAPEALGTVGFKESLLSLGAFPECRKQIWRIGSLQCPSGVFAAARRKMQADTIIPLNTTSSRQASPLEACPSCTLPQALATDQSRGE